jgi:hypothetical protein
LRLREALAKADPDNAEAQTDLVIGYYSLATLQREDFAYPRALELYQRALGRLDRLFAAGKLKNQPEWVENRKEFAEMIALCEASRRAVDDPRFALAQRAAIQPELLAARVVGLADRGRGAEAEATAERLGRLDPKQVATLLLAARCYARLVASPTALNKAGARERAAARAVALLVEARAVGGFKTQTDRDRLAIAEDFDALRDRADFRALQADLVVPADPFAK